MRKRFLRTVIGFVTFVVGVSFVFVTGKLPTSEDEKVFIVEPVYQGEIGIARFQPTSRGCRNGYIQSYDTDDGQFLAEGITVDSAKKIKRVLRKWIRDSKQVIERVPKFRNHRGEVGERIVILNKPIGEGKESVSIVFHDG